jgi:hypothetical protein
MLTNLGQQSTPILPRAMRPSDGWEIISSGEFHPKIGDSIKKASRWTTAVTCVYRSAPSRSSVS